MPDKGKDYKTSGSDDPGNLQAPKLFAEIVRVNYASAMAVTAGFVVLEANEAYARLFGAKNADALRGADLSGVLTPESMNAALERLRRYGMGETLSNAQVYEGTTLDGKPLTFEVSGIGWPENPSITLQSARDITERERSLEDLRTSEKLYRTLAEVIPAGIVLRGISGALYYANQEATRLTGYSKDEIAQYALLDGFDEESRSKVIDASAKGIPLALSHVEVTRKDGSKVWMSGACEPVFDSDGTYEGLCFVFWEITVQRNAERELLVYKQAVEQAADGLAVSDLDGRIILVNNAWAQMHGWSADELVGKNLSVFHTEEQYRDEVVPFLEELKKDGARQGEVEHVRADGTAFPTQMSCTRLNDTGGGISGLVAVAQDITEKKRALERLQSAENLYKTVANTVPVAVILRDPSNKVIYVNDQAVSITGFSKEEIAADAVLKALTEEDRQSVLRDWKRQSHIVPREFRMIHKDGSTLWTLGATRSIHNADGTYAGMCNAFIDITDRKKTLEELERKTEDISALLDAFPDLYFRMNKDLVIVGFHAAPGTQPMVEAGQFLYKPLEDYLPEDVAKNARASAQQVFETGQLATVDYDLMINGELRHEQARFAPFGDEVVCMVQDVTDRKRSREALAMYKQAVEQAADGIAVVDLDGYVLLLNQAWADMHGRSLNDLIGKNMSIFHTDEQYRDEVVPFIERTYAEGTHEGDVGHLRADGSEFPTRMSCALLKDEHEKIAGVVGVARDITERKQADAELKRKNEALELSFRTQREFTRNVTHDIRTPMTSVMGYAKILLENTVGPLNQQQRSLLEKMLVSSELLLHMMDTVLETAKISSGITDLRTRMASPTKVAKNVVDALYSQAARKRLSLVYRGPSHKITAIYDRDKIRMILQNLVSNAIKYTNAGGVEVIASATKRFTEVIVVDSGIGIREDQISSIFEEFKQLNEPSSKGGVGFGLGLSIVAQLVETIQATLIVSSAIGVGTAFTLYVPALYNPNDVDQGAA